jgi:conjugal transfer ATP-binding protein TraC
MRAKYIHADFKRERLAPHFVYESYDAETGFFFNRGSIGFVLIANPLPGAELTAQSEIAEFIANRENLPDGSSLQVLSVGSNDVRFLLNRWQSERSGNGKIFEDLASRRCQFLQEKAREEGVVKDSHLLISVTVPEMNTCIIAMERRRESLINCFKTIGLWTDSVDDIVLLSFLHKFWGNKKDVSIRVNPYESLSCQILPEDFSLYEDNDIVYLNDQEGFICLDAEDRPEEWSLGLMDLFLGNESRRGEYIGTDYLIHVGIHILKNQAMEKTALITKREAIEKNLKSGMGKWFPDLSEEARDMQCAVSSIQAGDRVIQIYNNVILKGQKTKIRNEAQSYCSMMRRNGWNFVNTRYDHLITMLSVMPMGLVEEDNSYFRKKVAGYGVMLASMGRGKKTVSSESKALLPIVGEYKGDLNAPGLLLTGRRGQLKFFSQYGNELAPHLSKGLWSALENYIICIAGVSGSGKSVCMQEIMLSTLGVGGRVFVLDYGKSFKNLCQMLGGNYIEFDPSRPISINPFSEVPMGDDKKSSEARVDFLASFPIILATMAAPKHGTTDLQQTNLTKALRVCWDNKKTETSIDDIACWLLEQENNLVANDLGRMLFNYTKKGAYGAFFSKKAELTLDASIVVIETDHLRNYPDLMAVVTQIMITHVNNTMAKGSTNKPNLLVFDEITKTLKNPLVLEFVAEIVRIVRKYMASVVVATQLLTDFHKLGAAAESIFEGASFKLIFKQNSDTLSKMRSIPMLQTYVDTDSKMRRMKSVESKKGEYGEFTIWADGINGDIARLRIDPFTLLLMSTNANDKQKIADYRASGLDLSDAINRVIEDRL